MDSREGRTPSSATPQSGASTTREYSRFHAYLPFSFIGITRAKYTIPLAPTQRSAETNHGESSIVVAQCHFVSRQGRSAFKSSMFICRESVDYTTLNLYHLRECIESGRLPSDGVITMKDLRDTGTIQRGVRDGVKLLGGVRLSSHCSVVYSCTSAP